MAILNKITLLFKILKDFIFLFFSNSSIQVLNHVVEIGRSIIEKIIWVVVITFAIYAAVFTNGITLTRYRENPTVISVERDMFSFNLSFPAFTICPTTKVNEDGLETFLKHAKNIEDKVLYRKFIYSLLNATYHNFEDVIEYPGITGKDFLGLIHKFRFIFNPLWNTDKNQSIQMTETITEMGICYSFNSQLAVYNSFGYWSHRTWKLIPETKLYTISPYDGVSYVDISYLSTNYKLYLHGPYDTADISTKCYLGIDYNFITLILSGLTIVNSDEVRALSVDQRKCRFYYESNLKHSPVYSYYLCRTECRISLALKLCGCLPHFYRKLDTDQTCDVKGLHCLSKYKENLIKPTRSECPCIANCEESIYFIKQTKKFEIAIRGWLFLTIAEYPEMRIKRDVIFKFSDLLVYTGGIAGLFLGCSVLSLAEIIYFFTFRLYFFVTNYRG